VAERRSHESVEKNMLRSRGVEHPDRSVIPKNKEDSRMRKIALLAALVGAIFLSFVGLSHRADAMTFSTPAGVLNAATEVDAAQPQQVWWRGGWRGGWGGGWRGGYWGPRPYYYGYYRPWPSYSYYPYGYYYPYAGWGWRRWWW
jgi:hypothetical protein